ncbi:beta-L-arabinofuranosidase domain-containing protein [Nocardia sp. NRRL S-836]|uniref:glycoside hydrolase family 127 protein n=1 Tax=Nocardia sp. NRRL S-836 TaxID=1519492 RepID=UPI0009EA774E|nr:beta-L-arabinofuranosidase domain-containing protein [Nocardia sp. NRRL S-836]
MPESPRHDVLSVGAPVPHVRIGPARQDFGVAAEPFPLGAVALLPGPFLDNTARTHAYLRFLDPDRLLHTFRRNVGLPSGVVPCGGWESPDSELRGHSTGHVLSALAQAFASTGDRAFSVRADYLVEQLAMCQDRARIAGYSTGYLSAFPEGFIGHAEAREPVWSPYHTLHKIMAGLLDVHVLVGSPRALRVLTRMAAWVGWRAGRLTEAHRQEVLRTGTGGMNEVLTNLYQLTGDPAHLTAARYFEHGEVFDPLALGTDELNGLHAGTQAQKVLGALRAYHATGTARYRDIAVHFWRIVTSAHTYAIGGSSNNGQFRPPNRIATELSDHTCECCTTDTVLKLTRQLFRTDPGRARYFDHYEKALYNHLLGAQDPRSAHGHHCYFVPLRAGGTRSYSSDYDDFTCCHGTGMETNTRHGGSIYFHAGNTLYVNLFIPSVLTWSGRGVSVRQDTSFPESGATRLTITGSRRIDLRVRVPSWAAGARLLVNGVEEHPATPGTYARIDRHWSSGDVVDLTLPMALRLERAPDDKRVRTVQVGPIVLAGEYGTNDLAFLPTLRAATLRPAGTPLRYTAMASTGPVTLVPFYRVHGQRYTVYWRVGDAPAPPPFIAHFRLGEGHGSTAADATGSGRRATLAGGARWTTGRAGAAVSLDGAGGHVVLPAGLLAGAAEFSVAVWLRLRSAATEARVFDFGSGVNSYLCLTPLSAGGGLRYAITTGGTGAERHLDAEPVPVGEWTHVAVTHAGELGVLYVNGAEVARHAGLAVSPAALGSTTQNWLGRSQHAGDPYLDAVVEDLRVYGRALTPAEVADLRAAADRRL